MIFFAETDSDEKPLKPKKEKKSKERKGRKKKGGSDDSDGELKEVRIQIECFIQMSVVFFKN